MRRALTLAIDRWHGAPKLAKIANVHTVGGIAFPGASLAANKEELEKIAGYWPGRQRLRMPQQGERSPAQQHHHHHGGHLHHLERFVAGLLNALDVLPPEIERHQDGDHHCGNVLVHMWGAAEEGVQGIGHPAMPVGGSKQLVD